MRRCWLSGPSSTEQRREPTSRRPEQFAAQKERRPPKAIGPRRNGFLTDARALCLDISLTFADRRARDGAPMEQLTGQWSARMLRLTAFLQSPGEAITADTWVRATGMAQPAVDHAEPPQFQRVQGGPVGPGFLVVQAQGLAQRIDWMMGTPPPPADVAANTPPLTEFGPVEPALKVFSEVVRKWLSFTDIVSTRLAIGIIAAIPTSDRISAYTALQKYIPSVRLDPEHTRETLYRINRPKPSRSLGAEIELNRVTTWAVSAVRFVAGAVTPSSVVLPGLGGIYVSVECDNSTPVEQQSVLDKSKFVEIYDELMEMALQNLEFGELP
jgi:hypothetical protein